MKVLFLGEIIGKSGVFAVRSGLPSLRSHYHPDFIIANVDSVSGGHGIGQRHAVYLRKLGINAFTGGDRIFSKKDVLSHMDKVHYMLRPANFSIDAPGKGIRTFRVAEHPLSILNLVGQSWHQRVFADNPFKTYERIIRKVKEHTDSILIDFHASSTAEKQSMFHLCAGKVSAVICTGQKVQTNDARIVQHTAYISDVGRCGSSSSVSGCTPEPELRRFLTGLPTISESSFENLQLQGVYLEITGGNATKIEHFRHSVPGPQDEPKTEEAS